MTRVVLIGLDGFPPEAITPDLTPTLWALDRAPTGGRGGLPSSTYPGFGSLLTGVPPATHGVRVTTSTGEALPEWAGRASVASPTLFDRCNAAGLRSAAIHGDFELHRVLRTDAATLEWPGPTPAAGVERDTHGSPTNAAVLERSLEAFGGEPFDFTWIHFNEPDSFGHDFGPQHPDTLDCYHRTDTSIATLLEALRPQWAETVVIIVSDHGMESREGSRTIALDLEAEAGTVIDAVKRDGGAALAHPRAGIPTEQVKAVLGRIEGVESAYLEPGLAILTAKRGHVFASQYTSAGGFHGGESTRPTVAAVAGGHPAVARIAASIQTRPPGLDEWAPTIASLLHLDSGAMSASLLTTDD